MISVVKEFEIAFGQTYPERSQGGFRGNEKRPRTCHRRVPAAALAERMRFTPADLPPLLPHLQRRIVDQPCGAKEHGQRREVAAGLENLDRLKRFGIDNLGVLKTRKWRTGDCVS